MTYLVRFFKVNNLAIFFSRMISIFFKRAISWSVPFQYSWLLNIVNLSCLLASNKISSILHINSRFPVGGIKFLLVVTQWKVQRTFLMMFLRKGMQDWNKKKNDGKGKPISQVDCRNIFFLYCNRKFSTKLNHSENCKIKWRKFSWWFLCVCREKWAT